MIESPNQGRKMREQARNLIKTLAYMLGWIAWALALLCAGFDAPVRAWLFVGLFAAPVPFFAWIYNVAWKRDNR